MNSEQIKIFIWKIRYARYFRKITKWPIKICWQDAGAAMENLNYDTSESPKDAVHDEISCWQD